jgi:Ni/Co efflux regulator RcnB
MKRFVIVAISALVLAAPAVAQGGHDNKHQERGPAVTASITFGSAAERDIRSYFQSHPMSAQSLPPGIAKNLARGKALPPGIAKRMPPSELVTRLPSYPGHEVIVVDDDVFLIAIATQVIVDILSDVF